MTKATRQDNQKVKRCPPDTKLLDLLASLLDEEEDGIPVDFKIIGKRKIPGEMEKDSEKFVGRDIEITTDKEKVVRISITST
eukprot:m.337378 g.337378  ORF g.337378 m.337378 type:complete len:82 (-) comp18109_c0_seq1:149-394(-)